MLELFTATPLEIGAEVIALRLFRALLMGAAIGLERELTHHPAGLRTHMLVALGACSVMLIGQLIFNEYRLLGAAPDPARMAAQVVAGIGFLGAGTIMREGSGVRGLTTAASIWTVACLGLAIGAGYYAIGLFGAGFVLVTLICFEWLQNLLTRDRYCSVQYMVICLNVFEGIPQIHALAEKHKTAILQLQTKKLDGDACEIRFHAEYKGRRAGKRADSFYTELMALKTMKEAAVSTAAD